MSDFPNFAKYGYQVKRRLGDYHTDGRITYLAIQVSTRQPVVIKQFQFAKSSSKWSGYDAYHREIQVLRGLNHPHIPLYLDCFETPTGLCLVQEYKKARSLAEPRSFQPDEVKKIAVSLLKILVYLQNRIPPVIHRDIKPENILADNRINVYLVDFGLARIGAGEVAITSMVKGTVGFMPPEQMFNRQLTEASDLYGVGATLVCLLTGTKSTAITDLIDDNYRLEFRHLVPKLSFRWIEWLEKMVQPKPKDRFRDAATALEALQPIYVTRTPEVKLSQASLVFHPQKLGEKLTQTITLSNPIPETVLDGTWEVAPHQSDPPHSPETHSWISLTPAKFTDNHCICQITVNTGYLMAGTTYQRELLLHSNALLATQSLPIEVKTAPIPGKTKKFPYLPLSLLVFLAASGTWFEVIAWSLVVDKVGNMGVFIAALVTLFIGVVGVTTSFVAKAMGIFMARLVARFKVKLSRVDIVVFALVVGFVTLFVTQLGAEFRATNVAVAAFAVIDMVVFTAGFGAEGLTESCLKRGFSPHLAIGVSLLATALGCGLGMGCQMGFFNPLVISVVLLSGLPLVMTVLYPPLTRARWVANYRKSYQHFIKP